MVREIRITNEAAVNALVTLRDPVKNCEPVFISEKDRAALTVAIRAINSSKHTTPHAEWKLTETGYVCSACGMAPLHYCNGAVAMANYCPNCGRQMYDVVTVENIVRRAIPSCDEERSADV